MNIMAIPDSRVISLGNNTLICFNPTRKMNKQIEITNDAQLALEYVVIKVVKINKKKK